MRTSLLAGTFNTRDIGGLETKAGQQIKTGVMFRSDALNTLTDTDIKQLQEWGLKTIVDFRSLNEAAAAPDLIVPGVKYVNLSPHADIAALGSGNIVDDREKIDALVAEVSTESGRRGLLERLDEMAQQMEELVTETAAITSYRAFLRLIAEPENLPVLHHCKGGKDRTGYAALLTLLVLEVPLGKIQEEYLLTAELMASRNEKRMAEYRAYTDDPTILEYLSGLMQTKEIYFKAAIDAMVTTSGSIENYLTEVLLVTPEMKQAINRNFIGSDR